MTRLIVGGLKNWWDFQLILRSSGVGQLSVKGQILNILAFMDQSQHSEYLHNKIYNPHYIYVCMATYITTYVTYDVT